MACMNLERTSSAEVRARASLNELISNLVVAYPDGAKYPDHRMNLPVHDAVWYGANPETISMLLMAYPESTLSKDRMGRSLTELNRYRVGDQKRQVQEILNIEQSFWQKAHDEAKLRLLHKEIAWPGEDDVDSVSVLMPSQDEQSIESMPGEDVYATAKRKSQPIVPVAWQQLEQRAIALEHILTEMNEKNYMLNQRIKVLSRSKLRLLDKLDELQKTDLVNQAEKLRMENDLYKERVLELEEIIKSTDARRPLEARKRSSLKKQSSRTILMEENKRLIEQYKELSKSYHEQRDKLHRLEAVVEVLLSDPKDKGAKRKKESRSALHSNTAGSSSLSALTDSGAESSWVDSFDQDTLARLKPEKSTSKKEKKVDIEWTPPPALAVELCDDLSAIFRTAAEDHAQIATNTTISTQQVPLILNTLHRLGAEERPGQNAGDFREVSLPALLPKLSNPGLDAYGIEEGSI